MEIFISQYRPLTSHGNTGISVLYWRQRNPEEGVKEIEYTLLKDDLDFLIDRYETFPYKKSCHQRAIWFKEGRKHAITHPMFGSDHPKSLRILAEDGYDGEPLTTISHRSAESFWDYNDNHVFPDAQSLVRIAEFFHLDLYRTLILVLKGQWEQYFGHEITGYRVNLEKHLGDILFLSDEKAVLSALKNFRCDTELLFDLLELTGARASKTGYNRKTFESLIYTVISGRYFMMAIDSAEVKAFAVNERKQLRVVKAGTREEREEFETLRLEYAHKQNRLDELSLELEGFRLKNEETGREYLVEFGAYELELLQEKSRFEEMDTRFNIIAADRSISKAQFEEKIKEMKGNTAAAIEDLRYQTSVSRSAAEEKMALIEKWKSSGHYNQVDAEKMASYKEKCKKILRRIRRFKPS